MGLKPKHNQAQGSTEDVPTFPLVPPLCLPEICPNSLSANDVPSCSYFLSSSRLKGYRDGCKDGQDRRVDKGSMGGAYGGSVFLGENSGIGEHKADSDDPLGSIKSKAQTAIDRFLRRAASVEPPPGCLWRAIDPEEWTPEIEAALSVSRHLDNGVKRHEKKD